MRPPSPSRAVALEDADWDFFLPDDGETYPEPGDFWIEPDSDE